MKTTEKWHDFKVGQKVHYNDEHGKIENGIVKALHHKWNDCVFVVYKCGGEWERYQDFTGALTDIGAIKDGWV